jgi:hypothetical protein
MIGGGVVQAWNQAYPGGGPLGLVGWQAAFLAVGLPGLLLAAWVSTLREPVRGLVDGVPTPPSERPFAEFVAELSAVIPPFTLIGAARRGVAALAGNLLAAFVIALAAIGLAALTGSNLQWACIGFRLLCDLLLGQLAAAARPADLRVDLGLARLSPDDPGLWLRRVPVLFLDRLRARLCAGGAARVGGGDWGVGRGLRRAGRVSGRDPGRAAVGRAARRDPAGRVLVIAFGLLAPVLPVWFAYSVPPGDGAFALFVALASLANLLASSALGAAAATTQDLVLPRMRGVRPPPSSWRPRSSGWRWGLTSPAMSPP